LPYPPFRGRQLATFDFLMCLQTEPWRRVDGGKFRIMNLTVEQIEKDIAGYEARIQTAQAELAVLPEGYLPFKQHKRREKQRRNLQGEIKHVNILIRYAREGISIRQSDKQ